MLQKLTIGQKLLLIVAVFSTVLIGMTSFMLFDMRNGMIEQVTMIFVLEKARKMWSPLSGDFASRSAKPTHC